MTQEQSGGPLDDVVNPPAAYAAFLWQLLKARHSIDALANEAFQAKTLDPPMSPGDNDLGKAVFAFFAAAGRETRNEIAQSIRNNCAGAILQIAWTLFDAHLHALGIPEAERGSIAAGPILRGRPFSQILWAGRNGFAHGPEWQRPGGPIRSAGKLSVSILRAVGIEDPSRMESYSVFALLSDGSADIFIERLQATAKDVAEATPPSIGNEASLSSAMRILIGVIVVLAVYVISKKPQSDSDLDGTMLIQIGRGAEAVVVPLAKGKLPSTIQMPAILQDQAIKKLSPHAARPFVEVEARSHAWLAQAAALTATDVGSVRFYRDLLDMCDRMDELYTLLMALPDPLELLCRERGCNGNLEQMQAVLAELLEAHGGFTAVPYRQINVDILGNGN